MSLGGTYVSVANYSMRHYQASDVDGSYSDATYISSRYLTSFISLVICFISIVILGYDEFTATCVSVYMIFKVTEAISDVYQGGMQKRMRMDYIGKAYLYKAACCLGIYALAYMITDSLLISLLLMTIVAAIIVFGYERRIYISLPDFNASSTLSSVTQLLVSCLPLMLFGLCLSAVGQIPRLIVGARLGDELLGVYASIATPITIIQVMANYLFAPLTTPFANYIYEGNITEFWKLFAKVLITLFSIAAISIIGAHYFGTQALFILYGESIIGYSYAIVPLVICGILTAFVWFFSNVLTVLRRTKVLVSLSAISVCVSIIASYLLVDNFGINGASFGLIIALAVFSAGSFTSLIFDSKLRAFRQ